ncbi:hypothetical protein [Stieleria magnilauensis]|uniref:Uncharacterized protein n=1 Tax=Stieleria magnilauensis TaxID=2527963 RepID=A0ABX5Y5X0_9BACT|nr:hypothetical protein TBK1r_79460 [Planctomycetes bacterium TBK1r]
MDIRQLTTQYDVKTGNATHHTSRLTDTRQNLRKLYGVCIF